jgi:hypothetical protein
MASKLVRLVCKYRWYLLVLMLSVSVLFVFLAVELKRVVAALERHEYESYVVLEYMPSRKKEMGRWPDSLDDLPGFIEASLPMEHPPAVRDRLQRVRAFHRDNYRQLRIVHADGEKCRFIIHLMNGEVIEGEADRNETL